MRYKNPIEVRPTAAIPKINIITVVKFKSLETYMPIIARV
jgi:hypothetical protein